MVAEALHTLTIFKKVKQIRGERTNAAGSLPFGCINNAIITKKKWLLLSELA